MKRFAFGLLGMGLAVLVVAGCGGGSGKAGALTIGNFNPFSGGDADFGPETDRRLRAGGPPDQRGRRSSRTYRQVRCSGYTR